MINSNFGGTQYEGVNISVEIVDTSRPPTYELSSTSLAIDGGDSVTITLTTTNVDENVKVAYVLTNIVDLGIVDPSGSFTIDYTGKSSISFTPISDYLLEGAESFKLKLVGTTMYPEGNWEG